MIVLQGSEVNSVYVNPADDILNLCLGVAMVLLGTTLSRRVLIILECGSEDQGLDLDAVRSCHD